MPKAVPLYTDEHRDAIAKACEKLWNGEPVENPIHSPRPYNHPLYVVGSAAHRAMNAIESELVRLHKEIARLERLRRRDRKSLRKQRLPAPSRSSSATIPEPTPEGTRDA